MENEGSVETARTSSEINEPGDRGIKDLVIRELDCYSIKVAALQETKWFGSNIYKIGNSILLSAGREVPQGNQHRQRGEGVAIVLSNEAVAVLKAGGEQWSTWGSRIFCYHAEERSEEKCLDSSLKQGAEYNTDHNLLRIRVRLSKFCQPK